MPGYKSAFMLNSTERQISTAHKTKIPTHKEVSCFKPLRCCLFCLFDLILYVPSSIFQLYSDGSSWVDTKLGLMCLAQEHNAVTSVRLEPAAIGLGSSTLPLSHCAPSDVAFIMLINVKMPTIVGILTFMSTIHFVLS